MHLHIYFRTSPVSLFFIFYHRHVNVWWPIHALSRLWYAVNLLHNNCAIPSPQKMYHVRFTRMCNRSLFPHIFAAYFCRIFRDYMVCIFWNKFPRFSDMPNKWMVECGWTVLNLRLHLFQFVVQHICNKSKPVKFELNALCCRVELENVFNSSANVFAGWERFSEWTMFVRLLVLTQLVSHAYLTIYCPTAVTVVMLCVSECWIVGSCHVNVL